VKTGEMILAAVFAGLTLLLLPPARALLGLIAGLAAAGLVAFAAKLRIGGWTGDVAGAAEQVFEAGFLVALSARLAA
jgi:adenosylcobinamide-GDP ribazoletransferase